MLRILILSFFISSITLASETPHKVGLEYSYSDIDNSSAEETSDLNDLFTSHYSYSYEYKIAEHISIGLGYLKGDSSKADGIILDLLTDSKIDYSAFMISAVINFPLSTRNSLYLKVNALQYDYDIIDDNEVMYNEDGSDLGFSFGWMYEFDNGIGMKAGYEVLNLGNNIDIRGFNTGISYRF
ncbi:MAG: porin family protein [Colwellia sp.]|nr:porin family protein [Colwellia sp.]